MTLRKFIIERDIPGQHVEEVLTVHVSRNALLDNPKERLQRTEVVHVLNHSPLLRMVDSRQFSTVLSVLTPVVKSQRPGLPVPCCLRCDCSGVISLGGFSSSGDRCFRLSRELKEPHLPHQAVGIERHHPGCG